MQLSAEQILEHPCTYEMCKAEPDEGCLYGGKVRLTKTFHGARILAAAAALEATT